MGDMCVNCRKRVDHNVIIVGQSTCGMSDLLPANIYTCTKVILCLIQGKLYIQNHAVENNL